MGITKTGRFSLITNIRDQEPVIPNARSRGFLVSQFLAKEESCTTSTSFPSSYSQQVLNISREFNGFNLLVGSLPASEADEASVYVVSNRGNHELDRNNTNDSNDVTSSDKNLVTNGFNSVSKLSTGIIYGISNQRFAPSNSSSSSALHSSLPNSSTLQSLEAWPKIKRGLSLFEEVLLKRIPDALASCENSSRTDDAYDENALIEDLFQILGYVPSLMFLILNYRRIGIKYWFLIMKYLTMHRVI